MTDRVRPAEKHITPLSVYIGSQLRARARDHLFPPLARNAKMRFVRARFFNETNFFFLFFFCSIRLEESGGSRTFGGEKTMIEERRGTSDSTSFLSMTQKRFKGGKDYRERR